MKPKEVRLLHGISILIIPVALSIILACVNLRTLETQTPTPACETPTEATIPWMDGSVFVYVPGGDFIMGEDNPADGDSAPAHQVSLDPYWIQQTEVSNQMYAGCVALGLCTAPAHVPDAPYTFGEAAHSNDPVVGVDWQQAEDYCTWIQGRLPSEAEWEYAARGAEGQPYPWGEGEPTCDLLNYAGCQEEDQLRPVGSYPETPSPFRTFDMAGNAFEWVHDWYAADYYETSPATNPPGPATGEERLFRSSSFNSTADSLPVFLRSHADPESFQADLGFRCVIELGVACNPPLPPCPVIGFYPRPANEQPPVVEVPPVELTGYCFSSSTGTQYGTIIVEFGQPINPGDVVISTPSGTLTCGQDANFPTQLACGGPGLALGSTAEIQVCREIQPPAEMAPACPAGYALDPSSGLCHKENLLPTTGGNCPVGVAYNSPGFCCEYPNVLPTCAAGYSYDQVQQVCIPPTSDEEECTTYSVAIPPCSPPDDQQPTLGCLYQPATGGPAQCAPTCPPRVTVLGTCELP